MGFYSVSQLVQDARRHGINVFPVNINRSNYENSLELDKKGNRGIRLGFTTVKSLNAHEAQSIETVREDKPFESLKDFTRRTSMSESNIECLASADAFREIVGNRFQSRWAASALMPHSELLETGEGNFDELLMSGPSLEENVMEDYSSIGLTLRTHPMQILRAELPFKKCKRFTDLSGLRAGQFVRIAGIVTGKQRPGTASGVMFMSLEDETGTSNVVIWKATQETFRKEILTGKLLIIKGTVDIATEDVSVPIVHVIAGHIQDVTARLNNFALKSRDFH